MKFRFKFLALALSLSIVSPSLAYASEVVKYDDTNLDQILIDEGIDYDKEAVETRKEEYQANPSDDIDPDYEVIEIITENTIIEDLDGTEEIIKEETVVVEDKKMPTIYSKTPVYDRVVDISEHQNPAGINYDKFAADIDGAILRTSITDAKTLNIRTDYHLETHYKELAARGVPLGFYHYSRAINKAEAEREADYMTNVLKDKLVSLPVYIDIEDEKRQGKASKGSISEAAQAFVDRMKVNGYIAGIYSYPWFADEYLTKDVRNNNEFWIADYESKGITSYNSSDFDSWQFSNTARVNGHNAGVDMNVLYRDYPMIINGMSKRTLEQIVDEVINGKWGVGAERKRRLEYAGYNYDIIQQAVNARI